MTTDKTTVIAKETATEKTPPKAKRKVKRVAKPAAKAPVKTTAKPASKISVPVTSKPAAEKPGKIPKVKVVRDSFTMPQKEYKEIAGIKDAFRKTGLPVKKSEVLRAGLKALGELNMAQMKRLLAGLEKVRTGRPKKH
jgi:hypothetical protein